MAQIISSDYDIYPKVFPENETVQITIKPLGAHAAFNPSAEYEIHVRPLSESSPQYYPDRQNIFRYRCQAGDDGCLRFSHAFTGEQEHFIRIYLEDKLVVRLSVYSVFADLAGRYPYLGDLHLHSCRSDGREAPAIVCANCRKLGYDFLAITDHRRYYPSLEAIAAYADVPLDLAIIPGEEVHLPDNDIHIVNFGGQYSVNGLLDSSAQNTEMGGAERSLANYPCPQILTDDQYREEVRQLQRALNVPANLEGFNYASCVWIFNHIKAAQGLGIYCHPYWISDSFHVPENLNEYMLEQHPFDAFEVLGGEAYFEQNGFQAAAYAEIRRKGVRFPIVGSSDNHNTSRDLSGENGFVARTIVFSPANERAALIDSIKNYYSVAVDSISKELRLVGDFRLVKYGCFLLKNFFPLHHELCFEEARLMRDYACGVPGAAEGLSFIAGRMQRQRERYFAF